MGSYGTFLMTAARGPVFSTMPTRLCGRLNAGNTLADSFTVTAVDGTVQVVTVTTHGSSDASPDPKGAAPHRSKGSVVRMETNAPIVAVHGKSERGRRPPYKESNPVGVRPAPAAQHGNGAFRQSLQNYQGDQTGKWICGSRSLIGVDRYPNTVISGSDACAGW
jgi:hypothetical protein